MKDIEGMKAEKPTPVRGPGEGACSWPAVVRLCSFPRRARMGRHPAPIGIGADEEMLVMTHRRIVSWWIALTVLAAALACSVPGLATPEEPQAVEDEDGEEITITLTNESPETICYVYISPETDDVWGPDRLRALEQVKTGATRTFTLPPDVYDVLVADCREYVIYTEFGVGDGFTVTVGGPGRTAPVFVVNTSSTEVCQVFISPPDSADWGDDWLGRFEVIPPQEVRLFFVEPGTYDAMFLDCEDGVLGQVDEQALGDEETTWTVSD